MDERRIEAVTFMRSYEQRKGLLDDMRNQTYAAHASVKQTLQRLNDDYERQKSQRTRISRQMDETRAMLCRATGWARANCRTSRSSWTCARIRSIGASP